MLFRSQIASASNKSVSSLPYRPKRRHLSQLTPCTQICGIWDSGQMVGLDRTYSLKGPSCLAPMASHLALYLLNQQPALLTRTTHSLPLLALTVPFLRTEGNLPQAHALTDRSRHSPAPSRTDDDCSLIASLSNIYPPTSNGGFLRTYFDGS